MQSQFTNEWEKCCYAGKPAIAFVVYHYFASNFVFVVDVVGFVVVVVVVVVVCVQEKRKIRNVWKILNLIRRFLAQQRPSNIFTRLQKRLRKSINHER